MNDFKSISERPIIFGEVVFDCFEGGESVLGGAPFNVAWHLQNFGLSPILVSAVGQDEMGEKVSEAMQKLGMDRAGLQLSTEHPTGHVEIKDQGGEPDYTIVDDVAYDHIQADKLVDAEEPFLLYHGTLAVRHDQSMSALQQYRDKSDITRFVDVNLRQSWWDTERTLAMLDFADYVKLNESELTTLAGQAMCSEHPGEPGKLNIGLAQAFKQEHQIVSLIVTLGEHGAGFFDHEGLYHEVPAPPKSDNFVDAVGAGDAFSSVLIFGIINQWDITITLARAQEFASFIVTQRGATCSSAAIYQDFLSFWGCSR